LMFFPKKILFWTFFLFIHFWGHRSGKNRLFVIALMLHYKSLVKNNNKKNNAVFNISNVLINLTFTLFGELENNTVCAIYQEKRSK
jgi:hypothetical protein